MDDQLELPTATVPKDPQDEEESSDEEGIADWANIPGAHGLSRAVIPKRGEKEFEPAAGGATALQSHVLNRSRNMMLQALRGSRGASSKTISYAVWCPPIARARVAVARGTHFSTLGHSAVRQSDPNLEPTKPQKRLELMPEEALYLMERGSLFCWREHDATEMLRLDLGNKTDVEDSDPDYGTPMTVQQAFTEMIGTEVLDLHHYLVYAYLKRLGYVVARATAPTNTPLYPLPPPNNLDLATDGSTSPTAVSLMARVLRDASARLEKMLSRLTLFLFGSYRYPSVIGTLGLWPRSFSSASVFKSLRTIRNGHNITLRPRPSHPSPGDFQITWNVWKPSTPWRKLNVPKPDFEISVVDARTTPIPDIYQLSELFSSVEPRPPPPPRKRGPANAKAAPVPTKEVLDRAQGQKIGILDWLWQLLGMQWSQSPAIPRPNPFVHLKAGRKNIIIAAVDGSMIHLMRFGEGDFASWPMV